VWRRADWHITGSILALRGPGGGGEKSLHTEKEMMSYLLPRAERSPSLEANRSSANQEIPRIFWELEGSLPRLQQPATCPYREPD
jgi:hypothetical protein